MLEKLEKIKKDFNQDVKSVKNLGDLEAVRVKYLGRKSQLSNLLSSLKDLVEAKKKELGPKANEIRKEIDKIIVQKKEELENKISSLKKLDVTKPGHKIEIGHLHPLTKVEEEIKQIFLSMNFSVVEGPEIEDEFYNFDALNIPANHPAREMWDTFWIESQADKKGRKLLRTHTSPMQIRYMEKHNPPFQIIVPGRVFRYEATDASHEINFYQLEGLMVGKDINLANFKFIIEEFFRRFFKGKKVEFRYRPSYFPFVEPGVEVDIRLGKSGKWLEVLGAGMVHRAVFDAVKYNPKDVQGFAFGMGVDRLAVIKYGVPDVRLFYSGDLRFIKQFK